jgi:hypothetical protein
MNEVTEGREKAKIPSVSHIAQPTLQPSCSVGQTSEKTRRIA